MIEQMLKDYLTDTGSTYYENFTIDYYVSEGDKVSVKIRDETGHYTESIELELLDVLAWVYKKQRDVE